jgi:hypothetical protein
MGPCAAVVQQQGIEGANHVAVCTVIEYGTNPPSSGDHYPPPYWAAYKTYASPVPEGFWVHDLEHGAVVLTYNCAVGQGDATECAAEVAAAQKMIDALPPDPVCVQLGISRRTVMTPDPKLDVRFAASAWGWTLRANCFDVTAFRDFALAHYDMGPESLCNDGQDPMAAGLPNGCGAN